MTARRWFGCYIQLRVLPITLVALLATLAGCGGAPAAKVAEGLDDAAAPALDAVGLAMDGGCTRTVALVGNPTGCRVDWSCADAGTLTFACQGGDAGVMCLCVGGEGGVAPADAGSATICVGSADDVSASARQACNWSVP
jgi:hypothetical protein